MLAWRLLPCAASTRENRQLLLGEPGTSCKGREPCRAPPAHRAQHACLDTEPRGTRRPTSDLDSALGFPSRRSGQCTWLCENATFAGVSGRGLRPCPTLCHVRCPHSISCVGLIYRSQARSPGPGMRPTSLTSCTTSRGSTCAPLPQHHAQATRAGSERAHAILSRSVSILLRRGCKRAHVLPRTLTSLPHPQLPERERKGSVRAGWQRLARYLAAAGG